MTEELHSNCDSSDDDNSRIGVVYVDFNPEKDIKEQDFSIGMKSTTSEEFMEALRNYSIASGKPIRYYTNEQDRMRAKCQEPCSWFLYASKDKYLGTPDLVVKSMNLKNNNCMHAWKNKLMTADWVVKRYMERIKVNKNIPAVELRQTIDEEYHAEISKSKTYRARAKVVSVINGSYEEEYAKL